MLTRSNSNEGNAGGNERSPSQSRILLVEDNPGDAELIRVVLERNVTSAVEVIQSRRLAEAVQRIEAESFQLIVLDLGLPDSNGMETLERMLQAAGTIPVVVLTGREDANLAQLAVQMGARECLCKNHVSGELLVRTISSTIGRES